MPRARNITCQLADLEPAGAGQLGREVDGGRLEHDVLRPDVQGGVRGGELHAELGQRPVAVVAPGRAEHLPQRREVGRVLDLELGVVDVHPLEPLRRRPDGGALPVDERDDPVVVRRVDDAAAAVAHGAALVDRPRVDDLDRLHVEAGVEDLHRRDHRVRHRDQVGLPALG